MMDGFRYTPITPKHNVSRPLFSRLTYKTMPTVHTLTAIEYVCIYPLYGYIKNLCVYHSRLLRSAGKNKIKNLNRPKHITCRPIRRGRWASASSVILQENKSSRLNVAQ